MAQITVIPYGDEGTGGCEVQFHDGAGYIVVPHDGEAYFPHGDGFRFVMAGDDTRVEREDGKVLWRIADIDDTD